LISDNEIEVIRILHERMDLKHIRTHSQTVAANAKKILNRIKELCKQNKVKTFSAFGSVTRDDFKNDSDIDFIVDFEETDPFKYTDLYFQLKEQLEQLLKRQIDLIEERGIKNKFFRKELGSTKILIYGQ